MTNPKITKVKGHYRTNKKTGKKYYVKPHNRNLEIIIKTKKKTDFSNFDQSIEEPKLNLNIDPNIKFKIKEKERKDDTDVTISLEVDGELVGTINYNYAYMESDQWDVKIETIDINPTKQGKGYGSLLLKKALKKIDDENLSTELRATFYPKIQSGEREGLKKKELIKFYESYGFKEATEKQKLQYLEEYGTSLTKSYRNEIAMFRESKN